MRLPVTLLKRCCIGFFFGMAVCILIAWCMNASGKMPGAIWAQLLLSGFYGACCMGGTVLYEIENWPLLKSAGLHWLITALLYAPIATILGWTRSPRELLLTEGVLLVGFLLILLVMYLRCKAQVRKLNDILKARKLRKRGINP